MLSIGGEGVCRQTTCQQDTQTHFCVPVTLTLTRWPWHINMMQIFWRYTCISNMHSAGQGFQTSERYRQTDVTDNMIMLHSWGGGDGGTNDKMQQLLFLLSYKYKCLSSTTLTLYSSHLTSQWAWPASSMFTSTSSFVLTVWTILRLASISTVARDFIRILSTAVYSYNDRFTRDSKNYCNELMLWALNTAEQAGNRCVPSVVMTADG